MATRRIINASDRQGNQPAAGPTRMAPTVPAKPGRSCSRPFFSAAMLCLWLVGATTRAADFDAMVDRWCAAQTNLQTWSANLIQTRSLKMLAQPLVAKGKVWMTMPNRFRWELGDPPQTIAVRQPEQLWLIYPKLKRAEKYPLGEAQTGPWKDSLALLEASFPRNRSELAKHFQILNLTQSNSVVTLTLQPKSASARKFMTEIQVSFGATDYLPTATELKFSDGSSMRNDFTDSVLNAPLGPERFEVKLAPDFSVVEPLGR